jgi:tetraacyldisaccharide 4'-kinase
MGARPRAKTNGAWSTRTVTSGWRERLRAQLERPFLQRHCVLFVLSPLLLVLAWVYAQIMRVRRRRAAARGLLPSELASVQSFVQRFARRGDEAAGSDARSRSDQHMAWQRDGRPPVIAVGNISLGGTGKSPLVRYLAFEALRRGIRVCVISRGYRAAQGWACADGFRADWTDDGLGAGLPVLRPADLSDENAELFLMASLRLTPDEARGICVVQHPERSRALEWLAQRRGTAQIGDWLVLLDDGLQHVRCPRDLEICVWSATSALGTGAPAYCLPAGPYREGFGAADFARLAKRSAINVWSGLEDQPRLGEGAASACWGIRPYGVELCPFFTRVRAPHDALGEGLELEHLPASPVLARAVALTGIALPQRFLRTLRAFIPSLEEDGLLHIALDDHAPFSSLASQWSSRLGGLNASEALILTGKDWSRFRREPAFWQFIKDRETFVCLTDPVVKSFEDARYDQLSLRAFDLLGLDGHRGKV